LWLLFFVFVVLWCWEIEKEEEVAPAAPAGPTQEELLTQIRDLLKSNTDTYIVN
jgi:large conductance mechanosensitive channel